MAKLLPTVKQTQTCQMHVCESHSVAQLLDSVNSYLKEGWRLHGNMIVVHVRGPYNDHAGSSTWFMQALYIERSFPCE